MPGILPEVSRLPVFYPQNLYACTAILRSKTPEMVRKELRAHFLAYNLIRTVMAQAARQHHVEPRQICRRSQARPAGRGIQSML